MKYIYYFFIIFVAGLVSCGSDEDTGVLRYKESTVGDFTMYVGSVNGGQVVPPDSIKKRVEDYIRTALYENYANTTISFLNNEIIVSQNSPGEKSIYEFQNGSLYLVKDNNLTYIGDGDHTVLNIRQHYISYKQTGDQGFYSKQANPQRIIDADVAASETPFFGVANMKSTEDTLVWCTRNSLFM